MTRYLRALLWLRVLVEALAYGLLLVALLGILGFVL
jgi:hypothetical protein